MSACPVCNETLMVGDSQKCCENKTCAMYDHWMMDTAMAALSDLRVQRDALAEQVRTLEIAVVAIDRAVKEERESGDEARVQRDEAVAALAAVKNPAPFPSERFVATVIAMMPEWFNDADATDSFRALTKALRDAAADLPRDTPSVIIERATGVPEAPTRESVKEKWDALPDAPSMLAAAAPPVAEDADALLLAVVMAAMGDRADWDSPEVQAAVRPVRARMRSPITAEELVDAFDAVMPEGVTVSSVHRPERIKHAARAIEWIVALGLGVK